MNGVKQGEIRNWGNCMKYFNNPFVVYHIRDMLIINGIKHGAKYTNNRYSGDISGDICVKSIDNFPVRFSVELIFWYT